jgi:hypothetical protein
LKRKIELEFVKLEMEWNKAGSSGSLNILKLELLKVEKFLYYFWGKARLRGYKADTSNTNIHRIEVGIN